MSMTLTQDSSTRGKCKTKFAAAAVSKGEEVCSKDTARHIPKRVQEMRRGVQSTPPGVGAKHGDGDSHLGGQPPGARKPLTPSEIKKIQKGCTILHRMGIFFLLMEIPIIVLLVVFLPHPDSMTLDPVSQAFSRYSLVVLYPLVGLLCFGFSRWGRSKLDGLAV